MFNRLFYQQRNNRNYSNCNCSNNRIRMCSAPQEHPYNGGTDKTLPLNQKKKDTSKQLQEVKEKGIKPVHIDQRRTFMKCLASGGFSIRDQAMTGSTYNIAAAKIDVSGLRNYEIELNFACNIAVTEAKLFLDFQILKQWDGQLIPIPASSHMAYFRNEKSSGANAFSFTANDCDLFECSCISYSVHVTVMSTPVDGTVMVTNPILIATVDGFTKDC